MPSKNYAIIATVLCLIAALSYNSWPLGFMLDKSTAHYGLASNLEQAGHPYYWLFILLDLVTAVCTICAAFIIALKVWPVLRSKTSLAVCGGMIMFSVFTAAAALLPPECTTLTNTLRCGALHGQGLGLDAITSGIAALGLFVSLTGLIFKHYQQRSNTLLTYSTALMLLAWSASGIVFASLALTHRSDHIAQYYLLILSGAVIAYNGLSTVFTPEEVSQPEI